MSAIIYEQTPGGLYPTGQRTVTTFPSGLIRVDQSFACKTTAAATHRATLAVGSNFPGDSYPAMDGLKIFPEPQEKRRDDGFTEFTVSGYGRTNDAGTVRTINVETVYGTWIISNRNATLNYVKSLSDTTTRRPSIDPSVAHIPVDYSFRNLLNTDGNQLANQSFSIIGTNYNTFDPHTLSFMGTGTVQVSGAYSGNVTGTGISTVTSATLSSTGSNQQCGQSACKATANVVVSGDVRLASFQKYTVQPTPTEYGYGLWMQTGYQENTFGSFREVLASFESF